MKKLLFSLTLLLITTGCMQKSVVSTNENVEPNSQWLSLNQKYTLSYSKEKVTKVVVVKEFKFTNEDYYKQFGSVISNSKTSILELDNKDIAYDVKSGKNLYQTKLSAKMSDLTEEELRTLGFEENLKDFQTKLEEQGLTCK